MALRVLVSVKAPGKPLAPLATDPMTGTKRNSTRSMPKMKDTMMNGDFSFSQVNLSTQPPIGYFLLNAINAKPLSIMVRV